MRTPWRQGDSTAPLTGTLALALKGQRHAVCGYTRSQWHRTQGDVSGEIATDGGSREPEEMDDREEEGGEEEG